MPLFRKPFFRPCRGLWYVEITRGKQINLGKDKKAAFARYHELITEEATPRPGDSAAPTVDAAAPAVVVLI